MWSEFLRLTAGDKGTGDVAQWWSACYDNTQGSGFDPHTTENEKQKHKTSKNQETANT